MFAKVGDARGEAEVQRLRGFGALFRFEYDEATTLLDDALARFESLGDRRGVAWALQNLAWCAFYMGRAEEAEGRLRTAAATFDEIGDKAGLGWAMGLLAWTRFQQGHSLEAEAMAEGIVDDIRNRGDKWALGMMLVLIGNRPPLDRPGRRARCPASRRPPGCSTRSTTTSAGSSRAPSSAGRWCRPGGSPRGST